MKIFIESWVRIEAYVQAETADQATAIFGDRIREISRCCPAILNARPDANIRCFEADSGKNLIEPKSGSYWLVRALRSEMANMTDGGRRRVLSSIGEGYCRECGSNSLPCFCARDK